MLKVILQEENPNLYFASIQGIEWVYAQGSTRAECLEYLESVLREVLTLIPAWFRQKKRSKVISWDMDEIGWC